MPRIRPIGHVGASLFHRQELHASEQLACRRVAHGVSKPLSGFALFLPSCDDLFGVPKRRREVLRKLEAQAVLGIEIGLLEHASIRPLIQAQGDDTVAGFTHVRKGTPSWWLQLLRM